jgi:hypothetical protein
MPPAASRGASHDGMEDRAAQSAADHSRKGVSNQTETLLFQRRARDIAADRTADCFNN